MFCGKCGNMVQEGAKFCTSCGATVNASSVESTANADSNHDPSDTATSRESAPWPDASGDSSATSDTTSDAPRNKDVDNGAEAPSKQAQQAEQAQPKKHKKALIITIVVIILIALAAGGVFAYMQYQAYERAHTPIPLSIAFAFESEDTDTANAPIGVPLSITGTDIDGNTIEELILASPENQTNELISGSYEIRIAGDSITTDGTVYTAADEKPQAITLEPPLDSEESGDELPSIDFACSTVPATEVTDELLADIRALYDELGADADEVDAAIDKATQIREAELARIAEEAERARQEKERQAALASNPAIIQGTSEQNHSQTAELTGVVRYKYSSAGDYETGKGYVCYLELPAPVTILGSQYGRPTSTNIILPSSFSDYTGETITIRTWYACRATASIPEAPISMIWAASPVVLVRVWP